MSTTFSSRPAILTEWDGSEFKLLTPPQIENLPPDDRARYVERLLSHSLDNGPDASPWYREWKKYDARCREDGCTSTAYEDHKHCLRHIDIDVLDPDNAVRRRATRAKIRMAELLEKSVTELELILEDRENIPAAVRLKAIDTIFDRANLPRQTAASVEMTADLTVTGDGAAAIIQGRLDRLAATFVRDEIAGIEAAATEAEIVEDTDATE
jgi:hypothetical protein